MYENENGMNNNENNNENLNVNSEERNDNAQSSYQWSTQQDNNDNNTFYQNNNWNNMYQQNSGSGNDKKKKNKNSNGLNFSQKLARCTAYALTFGLVGGAIFQGSSYVTGNLLGTSNAVAVSTQNIDSAKTIAATTTAAAADISGVTDVSKIVSEVMPSVVAITNLSQEEVQTWFGQTRTYESESAGSGIIIKQDSDYIYIATNNHVVDGATNLTVQFSDESTATAEVQGTSVDNDLAVIKIALKDLSEDTMKKIKVASWGNSDDMVVGQSAIAIGNALGYGQSVTTGVISALERAVTSQDEKTGQSTVNYLIQTDAAINPGNSGGALVNMNGEIVGVNSAKYSDTSVEGMGFAIPANTAKNIVEQLIENGVVTNTGKAYLGIIGTDVTEKVANTYNMPEGVYITKVLEDSAAAKAGITQGTIVTAVDGTELSSMAELKAQISKHQPGDKITLTVQTTQNSGYVESTVEVTLGEYTENDEATVQESIKDNQRNGMDSGEDEDEQIPEEDDDQQNDDDNQFPFNPFER